MVYSEYDEEILMRILNLPGIDIQAVNNDGNTPLHYLGAYFRNPNCSRPFDFMMKKGEWRERRENEEDRCRIECKESFWRDTVAQDSI